MSEFPRWMRARPSGFVHWILAKDGSQPLPACGRGSTVLGFTDDCPPLARRCPMCRWAFERAARTETP